MLNAGCPCKRYDISSCFHQQGAASLNQASMVFAAVDSLFMHQLNASVWKTFQPAFDEEDKFLGCHGAATSANFGISCRAHLGLNSSMLLDLPIVVLQNNPTFYCLFCRFLQDHVIFTVFSFEFSSVLCRKKMLSSSHNWRQKACLCVMSKVRSIHDLYKSWDSFGFQTHCRGEHFITRSLHLLRL